jgi:hypothetical protein
MDKDQDGFINLDEWSEGIDQLLILTPQVKERFFNFMDQERLGMVDLKAFNKIMKTGEFDKMKPVNKDNFHWQQGVVKRIVDWVQKKRLPAQEAF